jgi:hypothetical protein
MKNTIITSISALVFLVIGLFIGKSNKQIEIQTVLKTNILEKPIEKIVEKVVEKPVKEFVDKYITNVVEKVVEAEIPEKYQFALEINERMLRAKYLDFDKLPVGISDLRIKVLIDKKYEDKLNSKQILETIEFEARKIGIKISDESKNRLYYEVNVMETNDDSTFVYTTNLSISRDSFLFATPEKTYRITPEIWSKRAFGIVGKNNFNQTIFIEDASRKIIAFCNRVLESRENK